MIGLLETPQHIANYEIVRKVGQGGMAEIFQARSVGVSDISKEVAIKRILPMLSHNEDFIKQFLDEARIAGSLNHPNIVQIYDVAQTDSTYFIVMEFILGHHLGEIVRKLLEKNYSFPFSAACYVVNEVAKALSFAHNALDHNGHPQNIVHRDVSPQNILVGMNGIVKLTDFGIAKATNRLYQTTVGVIKGKFSYLAPELLEGKSASPQSDLFSLGVVLWEILSGQRLFLGKSDLNTIRLIQNCVVPDIREIRPDVPLELWEIICKLLAKQPEERYFSAHDLNRDMEYFLSIYPHGGIHATKGFMESVFAENGLEDPLSDSTIQNYGEDATSQEIGNTLNSQPHAEETTNALNPVYNHPDFSAHRERELAQKYTQSEDDMSTEPSKEEKKSEDTTDRVPVHTPKSSMKKVVFFLVFLVLVASVGTVGYLFKDEWWGEPVLPKQKTVAKAQVTLELIPETAEVFLNEKRVDGSGKSRVLRGLEAGTTYQIEIRNAGYKSQKRLLILEDGDQTKIRITLSETQPPSTP